MATSTEKIVPRTDAVDVGVFTSYRDDPLSSFVTTCQVRPIVWAIEMTVPPSASVERAWTTSCVFSSRRTLEPSKYVISAIAFAPVRTVSPAASRSPSRAGTN